MSLGVSRLYAPPRYYHYDYSSLCGLSPAAATTTTTISQSFWNNSNNNLARHTTARPQRPPTTRTFVCSRLITQDRRRRRPFDQRANVPTSPLPQRATRPLFPGVVALCLCCLIGIAGTHPPCLSLARSLSPSAYSPSESRLAPVGRATPAAALFLLISC